MNSFIPVAKPSIGDEEKRKVLEVLDSGILTTGKYTLDFEEKFANYVGTNYAISTTSGTVALDVALKA